MQLGGNNAPGLNLSNAPMQAMNPMNQNLQQNGSSYTDKTVNTPTTTSIPGPANGRKSKARSAKEFKAPRQTKKAKLAAEKDGE